MPCRGWLDVAEGNVAGGERARAVWNKFAENEKKETEEGGREKNDEDTEQKTEPHTRECKKKHVNKT